MAELHSCCNLEIYPSSVAEKIDEMWWWKDNDGILRPYLGISIIGHPCARYLWLNFRWFSYDLTEGRMHRLFRRGHREEETVTDDLQGIGMILEYILDTQMDIDFGMHVKGHPDGLILSGVPEAPKAMHTLEIKTHSKAHFDELVKKGVAQAKPMHWTQMQCEMLGASLKLGREVDRALYVAVCKDDDRMYTERAHLDRPFAEGAIRRGQNIATSDYMPAPISMKPDWWQCQYCRFRDLCHGGTVLPDINCRTCVHFTAEKDGTCTCACYGGKVIPVEAQRKGCPCHAFHPDMVPRWKLVEERCTKDSACYLIPEIGEVMNGWEGYSSQEIRKAIEGGKGDKPQRIPEEGNTVDF